MKLILTAQVDEVYVQKIYFVGSIHYSMKIEPSKISYGFWAIDEILKKMAKVNQIVEENSSLISRLFKFVEHLMHSGYYLQQEKLSIHHVKHPSELNVQNELYLGFNMHKLNMQKISRVLETNDDLLMKDIQDDASKCIFGKVLDELDPVNANIPVAEMNSFHRHFGLQVKLLYRINR